MDRYDLLHKEYDLLEHSGILADVAKDNLDEMIGNYMEDVMNIDPYMKDANEVYHLILTNVITLIYRDRFNN